MPCCGRWRARHVCSHIIFPMLIVMLANVMWITTDLAGPLLPTDQIKNVLQQAITPIVSFGITSVALKVAMGVRWNSARSTNGVKLSDLLSSTSGPKVLRGTGFRERILYVLVAGASFQNLLMNVGPVRRVLVPGFATEINGTVFRPTDNPDATIAADWWVSDGAILQPANIEDYVRKSGLKKPDVTSAPALLAYSQFDFFSGTVSQADPRPAAMEVVIPAVFLANQNLDAVDFQADDSTSWADNYFNARSASYIIEFSWTYYSTIDLEAVKLCITPIAPSEDGDYACVFMGYQSVTASVAYNEGGQILGSQILGRNKTVNLYSVGYLNSSSFEELLPLWDPAMATDLIKQTLYGQLSGVYNNEVVPGVYGVYRPSTPYPIVGIAAYVAVATGTLLLLCTLLSTLDPKESIEPPGLLALSRWPTELAAELYGTKESLSKAGKKRVFLHETGPKEWVLSSEKAVEPAVVQLPYQSGSQPSSGSEEMVEKPSRLHKLSHGPRPSMPKRLSSSSSKRHSDTYRVSRPSYSSRPSYQSRPSYHSKSSYSPPRLSPRPSSSPVPGSGSRPGYPSRPSYSSRPSYHSRPSSSSRDRPSLSRSRSQEREEYFESEEGPTRWGVHDIR